MAPPRLSSNLLAFLAFLILPAQIGCYGTLWAANCATDYPGPTCSLYSLDLNSNPVSVTNYLTWTPPVSDPFDQNATTAIDMTRQEIWVFEGDCNGQIYRISLRSNTSFSIVQLPKPVLCIAHAIYDIGTDKVYLMGGNTMGDPRLWFVTIDPGTNSVTSISGPLKTNDRIGTKVLHPFNSLSAIDGTRGTYVTTFCCTPSNGRTFVNISLATGQITGWVDGGLDTLQTRFHNGMFLGYQFDSLVRIDLTTGTVSPFLTLPNSEFDASDQLMGVWSPLLSDNVTFVQLWHNSPDHFFVTIVSNYKTIETRNVRADRFTFAPQGNAPFPWRPTFFFEGQYQPERF